VGASPNRFNRLKEIAMPTLIIHGTEDPLIPIDHGILLADNIVGAKKLILKGVGHEIPDELLSEIIPVMSAHFKSN
jgi:pimeloyl-ACP methyl ester carboxylesterase